MCRFSKGLNKAFKGKVLRHYLIMYLFLLPNVVIFTYTIVAIEVNEIPFVFKYYGPLKYVDYISFLAYLAFRITEPHFLNSLCPCGRKKKKSGVFKDSYSSFLNSTSNIDYVYMILAGVQLVN